MTHCDPIFDEDVDTSDSKPRLLAHRGIIKSADNLLVFLRQSQLLEKTLEEHPDYVVVTTGHSLGAGIASILALKLRRYFQQKTSSPRSSPSMGAGTRSTASSITTATEVRCFAFSPPGGLLSVDAQKLSRECVMSVVLDLDFIPRLSWHTFVKLRDALIREIEKADEPKFEILAKGFCSALGRCAVDCCGQRSRRRRGTARRRGRVNNEEDDREESPRSLDDQDRLLGVGVTANYTDEGIN